MKQFSCSYFFYISSRPGFQKRVPGEGMPITKNPQEKGDLIIEFDIEFPEVLAPERKDLIRRALLH